jgi:sec-independent protein translocase protein TatA
MPGPGEWIIIAAIALLFFGKRLPEVGRSLGKGIVEFKKGLKSIEDDVEDQSNQPSATQRPALPDSYKFHPMTGQPIQQQQQAPAETVSRDPQKPAFKFDPYTGQPLQSQ